MVDFAHAFLLVFGQLAVGGLFALSVPPFHEIERGFFKSTAGVYLGCALTATLGQGYLTFTMRPEWSSEKGVEAGLWGVFCLFLGLYVYTLWGDPFVLRARAYLLGLLSGLMALSMSAWSYCLTPFPSIETFSYPLSFLTSALLLGSVTTAMSLGHWYLIDVGLSIDPLKRLFKFYLGTLVVHLGMLGFEGVLLLGAGGEPTLLALERLWQEYGLLLGLRLAVGPLASLPLAYMIWRTLLIPQTMAATGLFYIATLAAMVGEFLGRFILFRTSLPL